MLTDPEKINALTIANHAVIMSMLDTFVAKSILTVDEAKSIIRSAITATGNMEGLTNSEAATSILEASMRTFDK